jgi:hypothetical protein
LGLALRGCGRCPRCRDLAGACAGEPEFVGAPTLDAAAA